MYFQSDSLRGGLFNNANITFSGVSGINSGHSFSTGLPLLRFFPSRSLLIFFHLHVSTYVAKPTTHHVTIYPRFLFSRRKPLSV